jgi:hypothetical protein
LPEGLTENHNYMEIIIQRHSSVNLEDEFSGQARSSMNGMPSNPGTEQTSDPQRRGDPRDIAERGFGDACDRRKAECNL